MQRHGYTRLRSASGTSTKGNDLKKVHVSTRDSNYFITVGDSLLREISKLVPLSKHATKAAVVTSRSEVMCCQGPPGLLAPGILALAMKR